MQVFSDNFLSEVWRIRLLTWYGFLLWRNKKIITGKDGYNKLFFGKRWGEFSISPDADNFLFSYKDMKIIDVVQVIESDFLLGKFYYHDKFTCWFTMERISKFHAIKRLKYQKFNLFHANKKPFLAVIWHSKKITELIKK